MHKCWIVLRETYRKNVQSKAFLTMIFVPLLLVAVFGGIGYFVGNQTSSSEAEVIQIVTNEATIKASVPKKIGSYRTAVVREKKAKQTLKAKKSAAYLVLANNQGEIKAKLVTNEGELGLTDEATVTSLVQAYVNQLQVALTAQKLGVAPATLAELQKQVKVEQTTIGAKSDLSASKKALQMVVATVICVIVFFCVVNYSALIAQEIASEKGTRIMEIILSSVTPKKHFYGKLLGILAVCLTQIIIYLAIGGVSFQLLKQQPFIKEFVGALDLGSLLGQTFYLNSVFGLVGLIGYIALASLFGSAVSRTEDVNKAVQPLMFVTLAAFYIGIFLQYTPDNIVLKIASFVPLFSTFTMPFRVVANTASGWEIGLSLVISCLGTVGLLALSASIYQTNVLIYGEGSLWQNLRKSRELRKTERAA